MNPHARCVVIAVLMFIAPAVKAAELDIVSSGNNFESECPLVSRETTKLSTVQAAQYLSCVMYVAGVVDGAQIENARIEGETKVGRPIFDIPSGVNHGQMARITLKYIHDNPEKAHLPTVYLILSALRVAFPPSSSGN